MLVYIILGTLMKESQTGYEIRKCIESGVGMFYKASYGSIYPILAKLLEEELVSCESADDANRNQKKYTITGKGRESFLNWLQTNDSDEQKIEAFVAKVFFFDQLEDKDVLIQIESFQQKIQKYLQNLCQKREQFMELPHQEDFYYKLSTLYYGISKLQSLSEWCEAIKKRQPLEQLVHTKNKEGNHAERN